MSAAELTRAKAHLAEAQEALGLAQARLEAVQGVAGPVPATDEYPRGTVLWFRRASRSDDRIPAVVVKHGKGWTMCGVNRYFTWADLQAQYFSEPLSWFSVQAPDGMGVNQVG